MGSLDDALEAVAPFADECRLQTTDWRRLFTYQFVHVDAGHLIANSIILLVLGSPLEMAHGPIVGLAFEAGVVLGCVEIKILWRVHRRDACSMAWRCRFPTARPGQDGRVIAGK